MNHITLVVVLASAPEWLMLSIVVASIILALLAVALMFVRSSADGREESGALGQRYVDPVLMISAAGVVALALAAWLLR